MNSQLFTYLPQAPMEAISVPSTKDWNGSVGQWIIRVVGGINPDDSNPGFQNVIIWPQPSGTITNASTTFNSIHGLISCSWTYNSVSGSYNLAVTVPANVTASVYMPGTNSLASFAENGYVLGLPATNAPGVTNFYPTNAPNWSGGATVLQIGSGAYQFTASNVTF